MMISKAATVAGLACAIALGLAGPASADPVDTVNLTEIPDLASLPVCAVEDCSDQPGQVGLWQSATGDWYLMRDEATYLVIDDTIGLGTELEPLLCVNDGAEAPCTLAVSVRPVATFDVTVRA